MFSVCEQTHTHAHTYSCKRWPPVMGWKSEERKKANEHRHNMLPSPVWLSGWGDLGEGLERLMAAEWKGAGICVFVCGVGGWVGGEFCSLFMLPHYQLLTLAKRQGVCNMAQAWLYPRHAKPPRSPAGPGAHIGSVCWLGDKFPLVRGEGGRLQLRSSPPQRR